MKIDNDGSVIVCAPERMSKKKIERIVSEHSHWIVKKAEMVKSLPQPLGEHSYRSGDEFLLLDERYSLKVTKGVSESVTIKEGELHVFSPSVSKKTVKSLIDRFYDSYGIEIYTPYVHRYLDAMNIPRKDITIRMVGYPKRLGSCSRDKRLSFSRRSLMLEKNLIEYVALHEVAHLVYFNHGKEFKNLIQTYMPDYKDRIAEIKKLRLQISHL